MLDADTVEYQATKLFAAMKMIRSLVSEADDCVREIQQFTTEAPVDEITAYVGELEEAINAFFERRYTVNSVMDAFYEALEEGGNHEPG
jgi:hypothetical protein